MENIMKVNIYRCKKNSEKYLAAPAGFDVAGLELADPDFDEVILHKTGIELDPSKPRVAIDQVDVKNQIDEKGYALIGAKVTMSEIVGD
ncbi:hypothetical protein DC915_RS03125 [Vibrio parahaemolyticus]|nr:hypothetical protein [Vibrio parahaemolyticus]EJE4724683.1 hypothetical protein [Vibrio parahaemolyticus]EJG0009972.1 hypothetical protein [Vibrio parahaemolyticus]EJO2026046.1 hypothetical protein [Vibrio parahaemolyticus]ELA8176806.1 hypothetical protein [Vibrio alginolyticus]